MKVLLFFFACMSVASAQTAKPLSAFLGHWESSANFYKTSMSEAKNISAKTDCTWSPQQRYLVCEQTVNDGDKPTVQLSMFAPLEGETFRFYRLAGTGDPHSGKVNISGSIWTWDDTFDNGKGGKTEIRTTNTFHGDEEIFKTEFSENGGPWTTMLEGKAHRTK